MLIYVLFFILILIMSYFAERFKKNEKKLKILLFIIAISISFFAAFRNETIGTDIKVYVKPLLELMPVYGFGLIYNTAEVEFLYLVIVWLVDFIGGNLFILLFILQFIPIILFMALIYNERKNISIMLAVFAYVTIFMGSSFNIMRQAIAIAFTIHSYKYIKERNLKMFILEILVSINFHITSILFLPMYFIYGIKDIRVKTLIKFMIISMCLIIIFCFKEIFSLGLDFGILPQKFSRYVDVLYKEEFDFPFAIFLVKMIFLVICFYCLRSKNFSKEEKNFFSIILILDCLLFFLSIKIMYAERITYYFSYISYLYVIPKGITYKKNIQSILMTFVYVMYFWVMYAMIGFGQIVPYISIV